MFPVSQNHETEPSFSKCGEVIPLILFFYVDVVTQPLSTTFSKIYIHIYIYIYNYIYNIYIHHLRIL